MVLLYIGSAKIGIKSGVVFVFHIKYWALN